MGWIQGPFTWRICCCIPSAATENKKSSGTSSSGWFWARTFFHGYWWQDFPPQLQVYSYFHLKFDVVPIEFILLKNFDDEKWNKNSSYWIGRNWTFCRLGHQKNKIGVSWSVQTGVSHTKRSQSKYSLCYFYFKFINCFSFLAQEGQEHVEGCFRFETWPHSHATSRLQKVAS